MFRNHKNSSPKPRKPLRKQLVTTGVLLAGMGALWVLGKHEDRKWQRSMSGIRGM